MSTPKRIKEQRQREMKAESAKRKYEKHLAQKSVPTSKKNAQKSVEKEYSFPDVVRRDEGIEYKSLKSNEYNTFKVEQNTYTGTLVKGIGTMYKSNAVPIISQEEATDLAHMRR